MYKFYWEWLSTAFNSAYSIVSGIDFFLWLGVHWLMKMKPNLGENNLVQLVRKITFWVFCILFPITLFYAPYKIEQERLSKIRNTPKEEVKAQRSQYPQKWIETEGTHGEFISIWQIPSAGQEFPCIFNSQTKPREHYTAKCIVADAGDFITVNRSHSAEKIEPDCLYWGVRAGKTILGKYYCVKNYEIMSKGVPTAITAGGGPYIWRVSIQ